MDLNLTAPLLALIAKLVAGASVRWAEGFKPDECQRVYFSNHTSHLDPIIIWSSLPKNIRKLTRPVAAKDYWQKGWFRRHLARSLNALLIDRLKVKVHQSPVDLILKEIETTHSIIIFPEGTRSLDGVIKPFKSGIYYLNKKRPDLELIPVYMDNMNRILPSGEYLPVPLLSRVVFGSPIWLEHGETKAEFLERAREAVIQLRDL